MLAITSADMAPPKELGKRAKLTQVRRPFVVGSTALPFNDSDNPRPAAAPDNHTHSWSVFVKGVDDTDVTYWLKRVQFKLHDSIPNYVRSEWLSKSVNCIPPIADHITLYSDRR